MPGPPTTPISMPRISCAVPTRCASWPPSPTPRRPTPTGAGPPRPVTRWWPCKRGEQVRGAVSYVVMGALLGLREVDRQHRLSPVHLRLFVDRQHDRTHRGI